MRGNLQRLATGLAAFAVACAVLPATAHADEAALTAAGTAAGHQTDQVVVVFQDDTTAWGAARTLMSSDSVGYVPRFSARGPVRFALADVAEGTDVETAVRELSADGDVAYVQPNFHYTLAQSPAKPGRVRTDDPLATNERQWHLNSIGARDAWEYAKGAGDVTVAVIDTGIQMDHVDLADNIVGPYDVTGDARTDASASVPDYSPDDLDGHGTHVAGIIAGRTNNGVGISGVSYNANVMPIRVFYYSAAASQSVADSVDIAAAYAYLLSGAPGDINNDGRRGTMAEEYNVHVANMSLGSAWASGDYFDDNDQLILDMIDRADDAGILTVCAAGNDSTSSRYFPSDYDKCLSVIALDSDDSRAYYSNYGKDKDLSAPGTDIYSTLNRSLGQERGESFAGPDGTGYYYGKLSGTSMAAPVVSGVAALMFAANRNLTPERAKRALYDTADDLGDAGFDAQFGWGKVNALAAVKAVAYTSVTSIDRLPERMNAGGSVALEGGVLPATASRTAIDYRVVDDGDTGAYIENGILHAVRPGTCICQATVVGGVDLGTDFVQQFAVKVVATNLAGADADVRIGGIEGSYAYRGCAIEPAPTVTVDGRTLEEGTDYAVTYRDNVKAGRAQVIVSGKGAYYGKCRVPFTIDPAPLDAVEVDAIAARTANGRLQAPPIMARLGERMLVPGLDYTVEYRDNVAAGTGKAVMFGRGSFAGTRTVQFEIRAAGAAALSSAKAFSFVGSTKKVKASKVKHKAVNVRAFTLAGASGKVKYKKTGGSKALSVNSATGKVKVRKGTKKGVYKILVKATCARCTAVASAKIRVK